MPSPSVVRRGLRLTPQHHLPPLQVIGHTATLVPSVASPSAAEPLTWTATITRSIPAPPGGRSLRCVLWPGEGPDPGSSDPAMAAAPSASLLQATAAMAAGASTATCSFRVMYAAPGSRAARLQVFAGGGGAVGLLGVNAPLAAATVTVSRRRRCDGVRIKGVVVVVSLARCRAASGRASPPIVVLQVRRVFICAVT